MTLLVHQIIDPEKLRQLYQVDGYSIRDIAVLLGVSMGTVHGALVAHRIDRRGHGGTRRRKPRWEPGPPRRTPRELWRCKLPYFDGRCEALTRHGSDAQGRCLFAALSECCGYATCTIHRLREPLHGFAADAVAFRGGEPLAQATACRGPRPPEEWDF